MTEPTKLTENVHPAALMLPWYVARTLTDVECQEVEAHLAQCPTCQQELEDFRQLKGVLKPHYSDLPGPSPQVFEKVMARIQDKPVVQPQKPRVLQVGNWVGNWASALESWLRGLFIPQWVPALAVALIVGQATLLVWMSQTPSLEQAGHPGFPPGPVIERSVPRATVSGPTINIRLAFQEGTSESEFRAIIQSFEGRLVDGPSQNGIYIVAVPGGDLSALDKKLYGLWKAGGIVRVAERVNP